MLEKFSPNKAKRPILAKARFGASRPCVISHTCLWQCTSVSTARKRWLLAQYWTSSEGRVPNLLKSSMVCLIANKFQAHQNSTFNYTSLLLNSDTLTGTCASSNYAHVIGSTQKETIRQQKLYLC